MNNIMFPILQERGCYAPLPEGGLSTVRALCRPLGVDLTTEMIQNIATSLPVELSALSLTVSRMIGAYRCAISSDPINSGFDLTATSLETRVKEIDRHSQVNLGFYYHSRLSQECHMILPSPISRSSPLEDLCVPIQNWYTNRFSLTCPIIGIVLYIFLIRRICIGHPELADPHVDWSTMINSIIFAYSGWSIPGMINDIGLSMKNQILEMEEQLSNLQIENMVNQEVDSSIMMTTQQLYLRGNHAYKVTIEEGDDNE